MKKRFNVTGVCLPNEHYMADISAKCTHILQMIAQGDYFTMNRPRQYGKTTALFQLTHLLRQSGEYTVFRISFEGVGDDPFKSETAFCEMFLELLLAKAQQQDNHVLVDFLQKSVITTPNLKTLAFTISTLVEKAANRVVLLIDEVDKSSNNQLFLSFLGVLRHKYLERSETPTFHSVVLAGVHDVKNLKLKLRQADEHKYNSPWNIASDFSVIMDFSVAEIRPMLQEYAQSENVALDDNVIAQKIVYYTNGHPYLVSKLCKIVAEILLPGKSEAIWTVEDIDRAVHLLIQENNTNFDEVAKNLDNNPELYQLTETVALDGVQFAFEPNDPTVHAGVQFGIFSNQNGLAIHNRIYQQVIVNKMSFRVLKEFEKIVNHYSTPYTTPGNGLDIKKILLKFQELMRAEYNKKDRDFLERHGRLVFLAFLKPILNGQGSAFKEVQISNEKRLDVLISYHQHQYVIELKLWRGNEAHQAGIRQLTSYLEALGLHVGYIIIFDHSGIKDWKTEEIRHENKQIFLVWV